MKMTEKTLMYIILGLLVMLFLKEFFTEKDNGTMKVAIPKLSLPKKQVQNKQVEVEEPQIK